jgi:hypothetical protein
MNKKKKTSIYGELTISGDIDAELITKKLSIAPTSVEAKGQPTKYIPQRNYPKTYWNWATNLVETTELKDVADEIINVFDSKKDLLVELKKTYKLDIKLTFCTCIYDDDKPAIVIDPKFSEFAAYLEAWYEVPLYIY